MEGKAGYRPTPGFERSLHLIGDPKAPVMTIEKGLIPSLFTSDFWYAYDVWRRFNLGMGLPGSEPWDQQDQWLMDAVAAFEEHYRGHFSPERFQADMMLRAMSARR